MQIIINGDTIYDGAYELDLESQPLTGLDLHIIKTVAGVRAMEFEEALGAGDYDLQIALSVIALYRAGRVPREQFKRAADVLLGAAVGAIESADDEEAEADPPKAQEIESDSPEPDGDETSASSGSASSESSDSRGDTLTHTGPLGSGIGSG